MAFPRRRNHCFHRLRNLLPLISAVSGALLILLAFVSFLAPYPIDSDRHHHRSLVRLLSVSLSISLYPSTAYLPSARKRNVMHFFLGMSNPLCCLCVCFVLFLQSDARRDDAVVLPVFRVPVRVYFPLCIC